MTSNNAKQNLNFTKNPSAQCVLVDNPQRSNDTSHISLQWIKNDMFTKKIKNLSVSISPLHRVCVHIQYKTHAHSLKYIVQSAFT